MMMQKLFVLVKGDGSSVGLTGSLHTTWSHTLSVPDELSNFFQLSTGLTGAPAQTGQNIGGASGHKSVRGVVG